MKEVKLHTAKKAVLLAQPDDFPIRITACVATKTGSVIKNYSLEKTPNGALRLMMKKIEWNKPLDKQSDNV